MKYIDANRIITRIFILRTTDTVEMPSFSSIFAFATGAKEF